MYVTDDPEGFMRGKFDEELEADVTNLLGPGIVEEKVEKKEKVEIIVQQPSEGSWKTVDSERSSSLMSSNLTQSLVRNPPPAVRDYTTMSDVESQVIEDDTEEESGREMIVRRSSLMMADYAYLNAPETDSEPSSAEIERRRQLERIEEEEEEMARMRELERLEKEEKEEEDQEKLYLSGDGGEKTMGGKEQQG